MFFVKATKSNQSSLFRMFKNLLKGEDEDSSSVPVSAEEERVAFASLRGTGKSEVVIDPSHFTFCDSACSLKA